MPQLLVDLAPCRRSPAFARLCAGRLVARIGVQLTVGAVRRQAVAVLRTVTVYGACNLDIEAILLRAARRFRAYDALQPVP